MKTSEQLFLSVAISIALLVAIVVGVNDLQFKRSERARIEKDHAEKVSRAEKMIEARDAQRAERAAEAKREADAARIAALEEKLSRYGTELRAYARNHPETAEYWDVAAARKVRIGMPAELVEIAWGRPVRRNDTLTITGKHSQWVWIEGQYAYIDDGICTAIQTSH